MKLSLFLKDLQNTKIKISWKWPALKHFKIISYPTKSNMPKSSLNSVNVCDTATCQLQALTAGDAGEELLEMAIKALRSKRLHFQPGNTGSILETAKFQFKDCVALAIDSEDAYSDFRRSMEEMVEAYGLKYWEHLEELLALFLRMNKKKNHGIIVGAFIDIFSQGISSSCSFSYCAAASSSSPNNK
ncbi:transcription repressor OFP13 [Citrus sinensis]|uniref:transcription repressor OFP13-like n=1 Tax=Citrus sinensis TaxID=2711 RepID=UPI00219649D4|nr:transcription repressor OFP13-like [Citrus sinensis]KAH9659611.1 transcription repressor OFP13 [Citrus sinensis]